MKTTYTRTLFVEDLAKAKVTLYLYAGLKYEDESEGNKLVYTGVTSWDIIEGGKEAEEIEADIDANSMDENLEYLVLHFEDGSTATFRNSHVDMFIR